MTTFRFARLGLAAVFALGVGAGTAVAEDVPQAQIDAMRAALAKYEDPYVAVRDLYLSTVGCVHYDGMKMEGHMDYPKGAMGIHFVNLTVQGPPDPLKPNVLIYGEQLKDLRLSFMRVPPLLCAGWCARGCCLVNGLTDARIGSATADIAAHRRVDLRVGGVGRALKERGGRHDLPRLTIAALGDVDCLPRCLYGVETVGREAFDCGDALAGDRAYVCHARANRAAVRENGASSADSHAAAVFGTFEVKHVAQHP